MDRTNMILLLFMVLIAPASSESCVSGKYKDQPGQSKCKNCGIGKYNDQTQQTDCKSDCNAGSYIVSDKSACLVCEKGQWQNQNGKSKCKNCGTGKYNDQTQRTAQADCKDCETGKYNDQTGEANCKDCNAGSYMTSDKSACLVCERGQWQDQDGKSNCKNCGIGKYNDQTERTAEAECKDCGKGKYNDQTERTAEAECKDCGKGKYNDQTQRTAEADCKDCGKGKYNDQTERTAEADCKDCGTGKYNDETAGLANCKHCSTGKYNDQTQRTAETDCKSDCNAGSYIVSDKTACLVCEKGQWQNQNGQSNCKNCGTGKYNNQTQRTAETDCKHCGIGKYNDQTQRTAETDCKSDCNTGSYIVSDKTACLVCEKGQWQNQNGQSNCKNCGIGKYNDQTQRTAEADCKACDDCDAGQVLLCGESEGSTSRTCTPCTQGKFKANGNQSTCSACGTGKYNDQTVGVADCKMCGTGKYNDQTAKAECKSCGVGKYNDQTQSGSEAACTSCEAGQFQDVQGQDTCKPHSLCPGSVTCSYPSNADTNSTNCVLVSLVIIFVVLAEASNYISLTTFFFFIY